MAPFYKNSTWTASVTITTLRYHARFKMTGNTMKNTFATLPIAALWFLQRCWACRHCTTAPMP